MLYFGILSQILVLFGICLFIFASDFALSSVLYGIIFYLSLDGLMFP